MVRHTTETTKHQMKTGTCVGTFANTEAALIDRYVVWDNCWGRLDGSV